MKNTKNIRRKWKARTRKFWKMRKNRNLLKKNDILSAVIRVLTSKNGIIVLLIIVINLLLGKIVFLYERIRNLEKNAKKE